MTRFSKRQNARALSLLLLILTLAVTLANKAQATFDAPLLEQEKTCDRDDAQAALNTAQTGRVDTGAEASSLKKQNGSLNNTGTADPALAPQISDIDFSRTSLKRMHFAVDISCSCDSVHQARAPPV